VSVVWTVARQLMAECVRMKVAVVFVLLLALLLLGLPFAVQKHGPLTDAVQSFLSYSLSATGLLLGILTVFLARSLADEMVNRQILVVMAKPVPRWQFILGKWVGMNVLNVVFLAFSALVIYGAVYYLRATHPPVDEELDRTRLAEEVLVARQAVQFRLPDFEAMAEREFQRRLEVGAYDDVMDFDAAKERQRLAKRVEAEWRVVGPYEVRVFQFENVLCDRRPESTLQIRYKTEVYNYAPDEVFRAVWWIGDPEQGTPVYECRTRHIVGRYHTVTVPADAVAPDYTLTVRFQNRNPFAGEPQFRNVIEFLSRDGVEVLFGVGTFEGNLLRLLVLMLCKLMFLSAVALLATTLFSFPVACLVAFTIYVLAGTRGFILESLDFASADQAGWFTSAKEFAVHLIRSVYSTVSVILPDFGYYDGVETLVNGRNVTLRWVLEGVVSVGFLRTGCLLGLAMLLFHRREVSEVSV